MGFQFTRKRNLNFIYNEYTSGRARCETYLGNSHDEIVTYTRTLLQLALNVDLKLTFSFVYNNNILENTLFIQVLITSCQTKYLFAPLIL